MKTYILCVCAFACLICVIGADEIPDDTHFSRMDRDFRPLQFGKRDDDFRPLQFGKKDSSFRPLQFGKRAPNFSTSFRFIDPRAPPVQQWQFLYPNLIN